MAMKLAIFEGLTILANGRRDQTTTSAKCLRTDNKQHYTEIGLSGRHRISFYTDPKGQQENSILGKEMAYQETEEEQIKPTPKP